MPTEEHARDRISVLVCDDHRLLTDTLKTVIENDPALLLVAAPLHAPEDAITLCGERRPNVVLMDIQFPGEVSGIDATREIKKASPATNVVIMTAHESEELLVEAVEAGASGFLRKTEGVEAVLSSVKAAAAGEILIDQTELARLLPQVAREREERREAQMLLGHLTEREREILQFLGEGHRNEEIAAKLFISPQTVQTHVRNILTKLGVHSKLEAVVFGLRHGAVSV
jgi:DNA-binding NarL/FixJ family response regulator